MYRQCKLWSCPSCAGTHALLRYLSTPLVSQEFLKVLRQEMIIRRIHKYHTYDKTPSNRSNINIGHILTYQHGTVLVSGNV